MVLLQFPLADGTTQDFESRNIARVRDVIFAHEGNTELAPGEEVFFEDRDKYSVVYMVGDVQGYIVAVSRENLRKCIERGSMSHAVPLEEILRNGSTAPVDAPQYPGPFPVRS